MIESQTISIGEKRKISISVKSTCKKAFEIKKASYRLLLGEEVEDEGSCDVLEIDPTEMWLSAVIQPRAVKAIYYLEFNYTIEPEELKYVCQIRTVR